MLAFSRIPQQANILLLVFTINYRIFLTLKKKPFLNASFLQFFKWTIGEKSESVIWKVYARKDDGNILNNKSLSNYSLHELRWVGEIQWIELPLQAFPIFYISNELICQTSRAKRLELQFACIYQNHHLSSEAPKYD